MHQCLLFAVNLEVLHLCYSSSGSDSVITVTGMCNQSQYLFRYTMDDPFVIQSSWHDFEYSNWSGEYVNMVNYGSLVNEPSPRAQPEDKVCLRSHNSLATSQSLIY